MEQTEPTSAWRPASALRLPRQHLLDVDDISDAQLPRLFRRAAALQEEARRGVPGPVADTLRGHVVATLFFEPSTRTRLSFELAAQRLGALTMPVDVGRSSLEKSESLLDTLQTLAAMGVTMAVVRHRDNAVFTGLTQQVELCLINAGNGTEAHPTQALLDAYTLTQHIGALRDRVVVISGDILHSRVARSNIALLRRLGARIILCGPPQLVPKELLSAGGAVSYLPLDEAIPQADVIMCLRIQRERHPQSAGEAPAAGAASAASYLEAFGLTQARFARARPGCVILHPGPVNRDIEIAGALVEHPRSLILEQVRSGLYVRMAILEWIAGVQA